MRESSQQSLWGLRRLFFLCARPDGPCWCDSVKLDAGSSGRVAREIRGLLVSGVPER